MLLLGEGLGPPPFWISLVSALDVSKQRAWPSWGRTWSGSKAECNGWYLIGSTRFGTTARCVSLNWTKGEDRARLTCAQCLKRLRPWDGAIIATFADDGPEMCSGLPGGRYAPGDRAGNRPFASGALRND